MKRSYLNFPLYGWLGLILILVFWILNWSLNGLRTHWGFFPLWLGYCLTVDALVLRRKGSSLLIRNAKFYILLFLISVPCWWLFEFINSFTGNWYYDGRLYFNETEYFLLASLSFSIVFPAVLGTAELASSFKWIRKTKPWKKFSPSNKFLLISILTGFIIILLIITLPQYFYPFIWISVFLIIEPVNYYLKNPTLFDYTKSGDWRIFRSLSAGGLICGFFWELWNYFSYPKWIYYLPGVNILHIFEMPLPGYIGYIPFSWEIFALYHLITGFFRSEGLRNYLHFNEKLNYP